MAIILNFYASFFSGNISPNMLTRRLRRDLIAEFFLILKSIPKQTQSPISQWTISTSLERTASK